MSIKASSIDRYSRVVFPIVFILFHIGYWMTYSYLTTMENEQF